MTRLAKEAWGTRRLRRCEAFFADAVSADRSRDAALLLQNSTRKMLAARQRGNTRAN